MLTVLLNPYFLLGAFGLAALAVFAARTSYVDTPTVKPETSDLMAHLFDEVERARRLSYPLTVVRMILRPGASARTLHAATRSIDTVVINDDVAYLLMPGCTEVKAFLERIPTDSNTIATWSCANFPADALTIGELMLKVGEPSYSRNGHSPGAAGSNGSPSGFNERTPVK